MKLLEIKDHAQAPPLTSIRELRMAPSTLASGPIFSMNALYTTPTVCGGSHLIRPTEGVPAPSEPSLRACQGYPHTCSTFIWLD